jgi:hypothetical protein
MRDVVLEVRGELGWVRQDHLTLTRRVARLEDA